MSIESLKALFRPELQELSAYRVPAAPPAVKLDANESPFSLPPEARARIASAMHATDVNRYPDGRATELRKALAWGLGGSTDEYVLGAGSDELIALLATAMSTPRPGAARPVVVFPEPTFVMYRMTSRAHGWEPVGVPLDDAWQLDAEAMSSTIERTEPKLVYYATPNNPTGNCFARETIESLVEAYPDTLHVIDEAYGVYSGQSFATLSEEKPQVALLGTLSKVGFAGARVGWLRLDEALSAELEKVRQPFNLSTAAQVVATLALTDLAPLLGEHVTTIVRNGNVSLPCSTRSARFSAIQATRTSCWCATRETSQHFAASFSTVKLRCDSSPMAIRGSAVAFASRLGHLRRISA